ncbi:TPA: hypothetical protein MAG79_005314, partial [Klebsiella pneumoniae]|nr:hypothetical protein [Klebsiella pneumoniae]
KKSAQIREILISESAWEEMTCLFAPSLSAVQAAHNGYSYFPFSQHRVSGEGTYARNKLQALSEQEIIVLRHLLEGASNFHIAAKMDISSKTVSTYKSRLMKKLNCQTLVELIGFANKFRIDESFISD